MSYTLELLFELATVENVVRRVASKWGYDVDSSDVSYADVAELVLNDSCRLRYAVTTKMVVSTLVWVLGRKSTQVRMVEARYGFELFQIHTNEMDEMDAIYGSSYGTYIK